jgi:hypothetical protein
MKVRELISLLLQEHLDAEVMLATQPNYPYETSIDGVVRRGELRDDIEENPDRAPEEGCAWSDVLICEGRALRYGDRVCWSASRKA